MGQLQQWRYLLAIDLFSCYDHLMRALLAPTCQQHVCAFQRQISTNFAYNKVGAVLDFGVGALERDHSAPAASSNGSTTSRQTRQIIDRAEPCFITKRPSYTLESAHWVNAVRKDANDKAAIVCSFHPHWLVLIPSKQERFLIDLGIVHSSFNLNDTSNLTNRKSVITALWPSLICNHSGSYAACVSRQIRVLCSDRVSHNFARNNCFSWGTKPCLAREIRRWKTIHSRFWRQSAF